MNVFLRLLASRKFVVVLLGMAVISVLAFIGKVDGQTVADVLKWGISAYAIGTGLECFGRGPSAGQPGA
jgi:predicted Na+-dependent transporter